MTKEIPLTQGQVALVDNEDYEWLMQWKWFAHRTHGGWVAGRNSEKKCGKQIWMHRLIINAPNGLQVDHKDGNGLNNTRVNLRLATHSQNQHNRGKSRINKSGYKGVSWDKSKGKWYATIYINSKQINLGRYQTPEMAAIAYDEAARKYHGEFAKTNF